VQVGFTPILQTISFIRAGKLRPLAVTDSARSKVLPDIPTVAEFVPGYKAIVWDGISAPAKTPPDIVNKLNTAINAVLNDAPMQKKFADLGAVAMVMSPAEFGQFTKDEAAKWAKVIKTVGIKAQ